MKFDAIIIGAGPAGATAARLLAKAGRHVALVEKAQFPRRKVCGEYISAATLPVLDACGVGGAFLAMAGPPVSRVGFYAGKTLVEAPLPSGGGRALGREHLDILLRDAAVAAGVRLFQPVEALSLARAGDDHVAQLENEMLQAPILIAASGSWSAKGPFVLDAKPRASDMLGFKAHFQNSRLPAGLMPLLAFPGGYGGMVHEEGGRMSLSCCIRRDALAAARARHGGRAAEAVFAHIRQTTRGAAAALEGAQADGAFLSAGPIRPGIRARYRDGIFFTGNLAGEAHPVIAEGISMAIQSSSLLADLLLADPGQAGPRYAREWRRRFALRLYAAAAIAQLAMRDGPRQFSAWTVRHMPRLLTFGAGLAGKAL